MLLAAVINHLVDPYGIHRAIDLEGINRIKPRAESQIYLAKSYGLENVSPATVILGNSRVEVGLDPNHPAWPIAAKPVYNAGLPGGDTFAALRYLEHAFAGRRPRLVVIGIDFMDFRVNSHERFPSVIRFRDFEGRLLADRDGTRRSRDWQQSINDFASTVLSLNAFVDSIRTIAVQRDAFAPDLTTHGFNPLREYERLAREEGYHSLFRQRDLENLRAYMTGPRDLYMAGVGTSTELESLRQIIRICLRNGVDLHVFIHPYHAHLNEIFRLAGLWALFEDWKRTIVATVETADLEPGQTGSLELWDFSGYNSITTENVPSRDDTITSMRWYWEGGHYKKETGDLILYRLLGDIAVTQSVPADFGVRLTSANLESHLARIREAQVRYAQRASAEMAELRAAALSLASHAGAQ